MPDKYTLRAEIVPELEKSNLTRMIKQMSDAVDTGIVANLDAEIAFLNESIRHATSVDDIRKFQGMKSKAEGLKEEALDEKPSFGKGVSDAFSGSMRQILGFVSGIFAEITVISTLISVFQPFINMVTKTIKVIAEFLRPFNDILITLFRPVLAILLPILRVFQTLMMPFKQAAQAGIAASTQLISQGMQMNLNGQAGGSTLISEGIQGALSAASLQLNGVISVVLKPLADLLGLGDQFSSAMDKWQDSAKEGVARVVVFNDTLGEFSSKMGLNADSIAKAEDTTSKLMINMQGAIDNMSITDFAQKMGDIESAAKDAAKGITASMAGDKDSVKSALDDMTEKLKSTGVDIVTFTGGISSLGEALVAANKATAEQVFGAGATTTQQQIKDAAPGFWGTFWAGIKGFVSDDPSLQTGATRFSGSQNAIDRYISDSKAKQEVIASQFAMNYEGLWNKMDDKQKAGWDDMLKTADIYMGHSLIPDSFSAGFQEIFRLSSMYMGDDKATIPASFTKGLDGMTRSTQNFSNTMEKTSGIIQDATSRMMQYATSYYQAIAKIDAMSRAQARRG